MNFAHGFLAAVANSDVCSAYYRLCSAHSFRVDAPLATAPAKEVLKAASGRILITKLGGPGTVFKLGDLPENVSLDFIVQGRRAVETSFAVPYKETQERGTFAVLCNAAMAHAKQPLPNPPYPRPEFHSIEELLVVFQSFATLVRKLASAAGNAR